jgi:hypothetical protein
VKNGFDVIRHVLPLTVSIRYADLTVFPLSDVSSMLQSWYRCCVGVRSTRNNAAQIIAVAHAIAVITIVFIRTVCRIRRCHHGRIICHPTIKNVSGAIL